MEDGLASLARSLAPGLARVAELRSEMRALRGAIELQLNERAMLLDAANELRGDIAGLSRRIDTRHELLTSLRGRQRHMDTVADALSSEARSTTHELRMLRREVSTAFSSSRRRPGSGSGSGSAFSSARGELTLTPAPRPPEVVTGAQREAALEAARQRMLRRGMLGDMAIQSLRERSERALAQRAPGGGGSTPRSEWLHSSVLEDVAGLTGLPPRGTPKLTERTLETALFDVCAICLETRDKGEVVVSLGCSHVFHASCCRRWLATASGCPTCRARVPREHSTRELQGDSGLRGYLSGVRSTRAVGVEAGDSISGDAISYPRPYLATSSGAGAGGPGGGRSGHRGLPTGTGLGTATGATRPSGAEDL